MRFVVAPVLIIACILPLVAAIASDEKVILRSGYNLREQPKKGAPGARIQTLDRDTVGTLIQRGSRWSKVEIQGKPYWIHNSGWVDTPVGPQNGQKFTSMYDDAIIRSRPGTQTPGSQIVGRVSPDTTLVYRGQARDRDGDTWYQVEFKQGSSSYTGYIFEGRVQPETDATTAAQAGQARPGRSCTSCATAGVARQAAQIRDAVDPPDVKGYSLSYQFFDAKCSNFIHRDGLGPWGRRMVQAARTVAPNCFYNYDLFGDLCPGYATLNPSQKDAVIAIAFAAIAQGESSCDPTENAQAVNDLADGLFQLEYSYTQRQDAGRDPRWCRTEGPTDTQSLDFQSECAVSTIADTICSKGRRINSGGGYWQQLKYNRHIAQWIRYSLYEAGLCRYSR